MSSLLALAGVPRLLEPPIDMKGHPKAAGVWFAIMIATFVAASVWSCWRATRHGDPLALILLLSGVICTGIEPLLDLVGMVWYPTDTGPFAFTACGRSIPVWVILGYGWYYGVTSYLLFRGLKHRWSVKRVMGYLLALAVLDLAMESVVVPIGIYRYYGPQPFNFYGFPFWWMIPNGTIAVIGGVLLYLAVPYLKGWRMLAGLAIVPAADAVVYFGANWPTFTALNMDVPPVARWAAAVLGCGLTLLLAWVAVLLVKKIDQQRRIDTPWDGGNVVAAHR
ncbi:MAG: hypothetical protein WB785_21030 [Mycobacterium sp.]|uniref:hypothetical protein n=1 Tax=Mycobacterium sp. TaxID=1785 RepID=UPI003C6BC169